MSTPSPTTPIRVIVSHPQTQHSEQTAYGLWKRGMLSRLITGFMYDPAALPWNLLPLLPSSIEQRILRFLGKRRLKLLPSTMVSTDPLPNLVGLILQRLSLTQPLAEKLIRFARNRHIRRVTTAIQSSRPSAIICTDDHATEIFRACKSNGCICILDQTTGHLPTANEVSNRERNELPHLAPFLPNDPESAAQNALVESQLADWVLCASEYIRSTMQKSGVPEERLLLLPYGVDCSFFTPRQKPQSEICTFVFAGLICPRKGVHYLLEAFASLPKESYRLILVGKTLNNWLENTKELQAPGITRYPYLNRQELRDVLQQADVFTFPSLHEGSALVTYEALACGLPVITTFESGSVVVDGVDGYIVEGRNSSALADKMRLLADNPTLRSEMSAAARKKAEQYSWEHYYDSLANHIEAILHRH
jgi:starch synthase